MTSAAASYIAKARRLLADAHKMLTVDLYEAVGRTAYLAAFHAAQALIADQAGKTPKTHTGVQAEFYRLTKDDPRLDKELRAFLSRAYNLKTIADYDLGNSIDISSERARHSLAEAERFVDRISGLLNL